MNVVIQKSDEIAEHLEVSINDERFDVQGWVNLRVGDTVVEIHIKDLFRACLPFLDSYERDRETLRE